MFVDRSRGLWVYWQAGELVIDGGHHYVGPI